MGMNSHLVAVMAAVFLASAASVAVADELEVRKGVVTAMQPVAAKPDAVSTSTRRQLGGALGQALGQAVGGRSGRSYEITRLATSLGADIASGNPGGAAAGSHVLMVRFDSAGESAFTRSGEQLGGIRVGSRVRVVGSGDAAMVVAE